MLHRAFVGQAGPPVDSAKAAKEQKAFDILVEACHKAKNGQADPSTLRALQPLLPKGTLKKFIARHADTFQVLSSALGVRCGCCLATGCTVRC